MDGNRGIFKKKEEISKGLNAKMKTKHRKHILVSTALIVAFILCITLIQKAAMRFSNEDTLLISRSVI